MEISVIKQDVGNELRNQRYYNEQEILRLVAQDTIPHQDRVNMISDLLKQNVLLIESVKLLEAYYPTQKKEAETPLTPTENVN